MDFFRKIVNSDLLDKKLCIPARLRHRNVEIIVLPVEQDKKTVSASPRVKSLRGVLHRYSNTALKKLEKTAWLSVAEHKHAHR